MKRATAVILLTAVLLPGVLAGCQCELGMFIRNGKIIAVEKHHDTSVYVVCKYDHNRRFFKMPVHQSCIAYDRYGNVIRPHDYLKHYGGLKKYGPLPGCEKEYDNYLRRIGRWSI